MVVISPSCSIHSRSFNITIFNQIFSFLQPQIKSSFTAIFLFLLQTFMELYSSCEANLTHQTRNSFRDVSFSSYLNKTEENMIRNLTNPRRKSEENEEIDVFGAEKYFKGAIEDANNEIDRRFIHASDTTSKMDHNDEQFDRSFIEKRRIDQVKMHTPSVRSNVSSNSRSGLLPYTKSAHGKIENGTKTKKFLARFGCNCIDTKATQISGKQYIQTKEISKENPKINDRISSKLTENNITRNDYFSFPVLKSSDLNSNSNSDCSNLKSGNLAGKFQGDNNGGRLSLGRKLSLLNDWDVEIPTENEMYIPSSGMYNNDIDSDSSSDLFELESFSTAGNNSFIPHRMSESNCYAPSEVSIAWSVVTESAADYEEMRTGGGGWCNSGGNAQVTENKDEQKKRPGILSGCTSHKAVRVAGDAYKISGGGPGGRRRLSDSMAVGSLFRGGNLTRFDRTRGNYGSDVYPMSMSKGRHSSQFLYSQQ